MYEGLTMTALKNTDIGSKMPKINEMLDEIKQYVCESADIGTAAHEVEKEIFNKVLELGGQALAAFFKMQGTGDIGEYIELPNGNQVKRLNKLRTRTYRSILGNIILHRTAYGKKETSKIESIPLDARLELPYNEQSHVLQEISQYLSMEMSYDNAKRFLEKLLPATVTVDTLERVTRQNSQYVEEYREQKPKPDLTKEGEILVVTADGKGIPIKQPLQEEESNIEDQQRNKKGPKPNRKRMAVVGGIYSVDQYARTAEDIVESLFRPRSSNDSMDNKNNKNKRPTPENKQLVAFLDRESEDYSILNAASQTFEFLKDQFDIRNANGKKDCIFLMDGQKSLWNKKKEFFGKRAGTEILDLIHVNGYLWDAAKVIHANNEKQQLVFMKDRVLRMLQGQAGRVIGGIKQTATKLNLKGNKLKKIESVCTYLDNNKKRMRYDEYLAKGYPIATGVIEGACRHYIKDRMERTGMRWIMDGAQAMLHMRSTFINQDWDDFTEFKIQKESELLYPEKNMLDTVEWPIAA
jgi:hypothetical protein